MDWIMVYCGRYILFNVPVHANWMMFKTFRYILFNVPVHANATIPLVQDMFSASSFLSQVCNILFLNPRKYCKSKSLQRIWPSVWVEHQLGHPWAYLTTSILKRDICFSLSNHQYPEIFLSIMSAHPQLYVYILYPMSAVAFCASIYMTLAVTVNCQKFSRTKSKSQSCCILLLTKMWKGWTVHCRVPAPPVPCDQLDDDEHETALGLHRPRHCPLLRPQRAQVHGGDGDRAQWNQRSGRFADKKGSNLHFLVRSAKVKHELNIFTPDCFNICNKRNVHR